MAVRENRIVIGLDHGTTYSGVAFTIVGANQHDINVNNADAIGHGAGKIVDVLSWPKMSAPKVPSVISYDRTEGGESQWGYEISKSAIEMVWTKLELEEQDRLHELDMLLKALDGMTDLDLSEINASRGLPAYPAKEPVDIITDYLSLFREHLLNLEFGLVFGHDLHRTPVDLVMTCPIEWSDSAKSKTFRAITASGFNKSYFPRLNNIILVAEPEAAALFVIKSIQQDGDVQSLRIGDCFVHCDAGGGTVDVASFQVKQVVPDLVFEEIGLGSSKKCGSTFVDRQFLNILRRKIGDHNFGTLTRRTRMTDMGGHTAWAPELSELMREYWEPAKRNFDGEDNSPVFMKLPGSLAGLEIPEHGISETEMRLTADELREAFEFSVNNTIKLITHQIGQVERMGWQVKFVALSGGFACSDYLYNVIRKDLRRARDIPTKRPTDPYCCWSAVARGAVLYNLQHDTSRFVHMRACRRNYGVKTSQPFSLFKHCGKPTYQDPFDGETKAGSQMTWLARKGDLILSNKGNYSSVQICRRFGIDDSRSFCTYLMANDDDKAPEGRFHNEMHQVVTLNYDLGSVPTEEFERRGTPGTRRSYYLVNLRLHLMVNDDVQFWVTLHERELARVTIPYT